MMNSSILRHMTMGRLLYNIVMVSFIVTILRYFVNIAFALLYLLGLLFHEAGHIAVAKGYDLDASFGGFTPFGAYINIHSITEKKEISYIALAGPACTLFYCLLLLLLHMIIPQDVFIDVISILSLISIVDLLPLLFFDGYKIAKGISCLLPGLLLIPIGLGIYLTQDIRIGFLAIPVVLQMVIIYHANKKPTLLPEQPYAKTPLLLLYVVVLFAQVTLLYFMMENITSFLTTYIIF